MIVFVLGSCRTWTAATALQMGGPTRTVQCHYTDEILQCLKWLSRKREHLSTTEMTCFRDHMSATLWKSLRASYAEADAILVEISSIKTVKHMGLFHNVLNDIAKSENAITCTNSAICSKILDINKIVGDRTCVFITHVNTFSMRSGGCVGNRSLIQQQVCAAHKRVPLKVIDPSAIVSMHGQLRCLLPSSTYDSSSDTSDLFDHNHYTQFMHDCISKPISHILNGASRICLKDVAAYDPNPVDGWTVKGDARLPDLSE